MPTGIDKIYMRGDSAFYENDLMTWMDERAIAYAISAKIGGQLDACIAALPESHWKPADTAAQTATGETALTKAGTESDLIREWAEVNYVPGDRNWSKDAVTPRRYLAIRVRPRQAELLVCGSKVRHFAVVTNRSDPDGGSGLDLIRWHRQKAGTIEHVHDVMKNELAACALPSQKFGANAAWLRLNVLLYNLLSAFKLIGLPEELHSARPKRLRFLVLNTVGKLIRHARETVLRLGTTISRSLADGCRTAFALARPPQPAPGRAR